MKILSMHATFEVGDDFDGSLVDAIELLAAWLREPGPPLYERTVAQMEDEAERDAAKRAAVADRAAAEATWPLFLIARAAGCRLVMRAQVSEWDGTAWVPRPHGLSTTPFGHYLAGEGDLPRDCAADCECRDGVEP